MNVKCRVGYVGETRLYSRTSCSIHGLSKYRWRCKFPEFFKSLASKLLRNLFLRINLSDYAGFKLLAWTIFLVLDVYFWSEFLNIFASSTSQLFGFQILFSAFLTGELVKFPIWSPYNLYQYFRYFPMYHLKKMKHHYYDSSTGNLWVWVPALKDLFSLWGSSSNIIHEHITDLLNVHY